jgi:ABC-type glutathione transport system ATPase component
MTDRQEVLPVGLLTEQVSIRYRGRGRTQVAAVTEVDLCLAPGEVLGLVGGSGSGKSSLARVLAGLERPASGRVATTDGTGGVVQELTLRMPGGFRGVHMVVQDAASALDPRLAVWRSVAEALSGGRSVGRSWREPATDMLRRVGLTHEEAQRRPSELSGGQKQRVAIARALASGARILICDEIVSALDVSVRARVMALLGRLHRELDLSIVFVSHDLAVVAHFADRVAVMQAGRVVEVGATSEVLTAPTATYTRLLLDAVPAFERSRAVAG